MCEIDQEMVVVKEFSVDFFIEGDWYADLCVLIPCIDRVIWRVMLKFPLNLENERTY